MHFNDFSDQALVGNTDNVEHVRLAHAARDDQRSRNFFDRSCRHILLL